jgi:cell division protein FtsB
MNENHNLVWMWLLVGLATTFSLINIYLFVRLLKKLDDNMLVVSEALEVYNEQLSRLVKDVEVLKKNVRTMNNEVKENIRYRKDKD